MNSTTAAADFEEELSALTALTADLSERDTRIVKRILKVVQAMNEHLGPNKTVAALDVAIEMNAAPSRAPFQLYLV